MIGFKVWVLDEVYINNIVLKYYSGWVFGFVNNDDYLYVWINCVLIFRENFIWVDGMISYVFMCVFRGGCWFLENFLWV